MLNTLGREISPTEKKLEEIKGQETFELQYTKAKEYIDSLEDNEFKKIKEEFPDFARWYGLANISLRQSTDLNGEIYWDDAEALCSDIMQVMELD